MMLSKLKVMLVYSLLAYFMHLKAFELYKLKFFIISVVYQRPKMTSCVIVNAPTYLECDEFSFGTLCSTNEY